jgi:hypothetical protein
MDIYLSRAIGWRIKMSKPDFILALAYDVTAAQKR